jgi:hypothetical protein
VVFRQATSFAEGDNAATLWHPDELIERSKEV